MADTVINPRQLRKLCYWVKGFHVLKAEEGLGAAQRDKIDQIDQIITNNGQV